MLTVLVQFQLPASVTREQAEKLFARIAGIYHEIPGLIRKYFLLAEDGKTAGGVYLWRTRQEAESFYNENFKLAIAEKFGSEPSITYFESPVVVDNLTGETITSR
ncbi:MAG: YdhR family protein [Scytolyngbya sp. HA4215-MV1]|jgi:hypothetical protein|nr:YdhR family protein [Scytolyngbya sp. HA4215-MV1]